MDFEHAAGGESAEERLAHARRDRRRPCVRARTLPTTATSVPPITIWLHTLQICPAPESPMRITFSGLPIGVEQRLHGRERLCIAAHHDRQRAVDRADLAAAHRRVEHLRAARLRPSRQAGARLPERCCWQSMMIVPGCSALKMPSGPSRTCSTSGESGSIVKMRVARRATSAGEAARSAPAATSSSTGAGLRLWTTNGKPAFSRFFAMGLPIRPRPMNPISRDTVRPANVRRPDRKSSDFAPSLRDIILHVRDLEQVDEEVDELDSVDRGSNPGRRATADLDPEDFTCGFGQQLQKELLGIDLRIAASRRKDARFFRARITEQPDARAERQQPQLPPGAIVPSEVQEGARFQGGDVEARRVMFERTADERIEAERLSGDAQRPDRLTRPELFHRAFERRENLLMKQLNYER